MKRTKQQVVTELRCSEIVEAGRDLFSRRGYHEVTIDEVAAAAGLSKATVYQYFPSKQDIYLAALREGILEMQKATQINVDAAAGAKAKAEAFVRTRLDYLHKHRNFFAVYQQEFGNLVHPAGLNLEFRKLYRKQFDLLRTALEAGVENGELAPVSTEALAIAIYESTRGMMLHRSLGWSNASVDEQVAGLMRVLWQGCEPSNAVVKSKKASRSH